MFRKKSKKPSTKPPGGERTSHTAPLDQGASETTVEPEVVGPEELPGELELDEPQSETEKGIETKALIRGSGAPGISDALTTYLREIAQYPPLKPRGRARPGGSICAEKRSRCGLPSCL